ncbi:hypothetical protein [Sporosarcina koreensis]|uniref:Uncharacterized protein n=1 Tax=Sporosarcina koreensis TaxID=334735 RepID=A0ABW0TXU4_9BACL
MSKTMILLLAGILVGWVAVSLLTKDFVGTFLIAILFGVLLGYGVKKKEMD